MHDDHAHDQASGHGHDDSHGHGGHGTVEPLEISWNGLAILALAIAAAAAVSWWAINNKPAPAAPVGALVSVFDMLA